MLKKESSFINPGQYSRTTKKQQNIVFIQKNKV